jgi:hypothetical protein
MPLSFFDTCALQHKYVTGPHSRRIRSLVTKTSTTSYISEWTVVEMASALSNRCRQGSLPNSAYDAMNRQFLKDIAEGRLNVRPLAPPELQRARQLIRYAGVLGRNRISSGDALVATCCLDLALAEQQRVVFYTSDRKLYNVLTTIDAFKKAVKLTLVL